jgi:hypothetical protein
MNMIMTFEKVDDVDNENYKENNEEDHEDTYDDDESKLVVLTHRNEKHNNYGDDNFIMLISFIKIEIDEELNESQTRRFYVIERNKITKIQEKGILNMNLAFDLRGMGVGWEGTVAE